MEKSYRQPTPDEALKYLIEGNRRYIDGNSLHPNRDQERRKQTRDDQRPFAVVVGCSDSRVPAEILFDQGIGDLFIVRTAGNVIGPIELASIEFAVLQLRTPLIVVFGHENCGAIQAVMEGKTELIQPVAKLIGDALKEKVYTVEEAVVENVKYSLRKLKEVPNFSALLKEGTLGFSGGYYHLLSGEVEFLAR